MTAEVPRRPSPRLFSALRFRNFRLLWTGTLISHSGDWLDQIALSWLVLEQTGSIFYLGMVNLCRGLPITICTLFGGAVADRMERRRLMLITQGSAMVLAAILALMVFTDNSPLWVIFLLATARGVVVAFNLPARQALISELVPKKHLPNALALNAMTMNLTKVIGPMLAGFTIALFGTAMCFALNAVSFLAVLGTLLAMRFPSKPPPLVSGETLLASIGSGFRFVRADQVILLLVLVAVVPTFFGQPYIHLLAVFAAQVFETGPEGLGMLTAAAALGSSLGALFMANAPMAARRGDIMLLLLVGFGVTLALFATIPIAWLAPIILIGAGACHIAHNVAHNAILQMSLPDGFRGRVLSILFLNRGLVSMGTAAWATLAAIASPQAAFLVMASGLCVFAGGLFIFAPRIRTLRV